MAEGNGISPENLGSEQIARTNQFIEKQGPDGGVMRRPDSKEAHQASTYHDSDKTYKNAELNKAEAQSTRSELDEVRRDADVIPEEVSDNIFKRLINKIKPPKQN
jgi:hypothetical protein